MLVVLDSHQNQTIIPEEDVNIMCWSMSTTIQEQMTWGTYDTSFRQRVHADDRSTFDPSVRQRVHTEVISTYVTYVRQRVHADGRSTFDPSVRQRVHTYDRSTHDAFVRQRIHTEDNSTYVTSVRQRVHGDEMFDSKKSPFKINVREKWRGNQEWTIQRNWQHCVHKNGQSRETGNIVYTRMDNPEKLATLCTQDTERKQAKQKNTTQQTE